jgi:hypothetical protein
MREPSWLLSDLFSSPPVLGYCEVELASAMLTVIEHNGLGLGMMYESEGRLS